MRRLRVARFVVVGHERVNDNRGNEMWENEGKTKFAPLARSVVVYLGALQVVYGNNGFDYWMSWRWNAAAAAAAVCLNCSVNAGNFEWIIIFCAFQ